MGSKIIGDLVLIPCSWKRLSEVERMDCMAAIAGGEWSSISGILYATGESEVDFMAQLLSNCPLPDDLDESSNMGISSTFHSPINMSGSSPYCCSYSFSQERCSLQSDSHPIFAANSIPMSMEDDDGKNTSSYLVEDDDEILNEEMGNGNEEQGGKSHQEPGLPSMNSEPKMEPDNMPQAAAPMAAKKSNSLSENSKKRSPSSRDHQVQKNRRNVRNQRVSIADNNGDGDGGLDGQSSASCSLEDDSKALNFNGKTRASEGVAADPQSLYARKRRERINERLRILQKLVPNGTKVDISTMLEEAVQCVEFFAAPD